MTIKNQELRKQRGEINERLRLVASSLRGSIDIIEDDQEIFSFEDDKLKPFDSASVVYVKIDLPTPSGTALDGEKLSKWIP